MDLDEGFLGFDKMLTTWTMKEKQHNDRKALSEIRLHFSNNILQDILKEKTVARLWLMLEELCLTKSMKSKLHLKQGLYFLHTTEGGLSEDNLAVFKENVNDLKTCKVWWRRFGFS